MGREIKRVALDFDWPLREVWPGFLNPYYAEQVDCPACDGSSYSPAGRLLKAIWYHHLRYEAEQLLLAYRFPRELVHFARGVLASGRAWNEQLDQQDVQALVDKDRLWDFTHVKRSDDQETFPNGWTKAPNGYIPTAAEVNRWSKRCGLGHDSINASICEEARAKRYGVVYVCPECDGNGSVSNPALEAKIEAWIETEPPAGEAWQVWETVSEGSPVSPVFPTSDALVAWLMSEGYSHHAAVTFVEAAWAPSMLMVEQGRHRTIVSDIASYDLWTSGG